MAIDALYRSCGWTVLDLTEDLRSQTDIGKLYGLTFDQWTDYGAYIGYRSLMTYIRQDFPRINMMPLSDYTRVTQITPGGELSTRLGFSPSAVSETQVRLHLNQSDIRYSIKGNAEGDFSGAFTTMVADNSLPIAIVLRDSAGTAMLESMAQHFRVMIVLPEGETEISAQTLMLFEPDYVIRLAAETSPGLYDMKGAE